MIDESWYQRPPGVPERQAAGGVVVRPAGGIIHVALARERGRNYHVLPKGGIKPGESPLEAARREIAEEIGITHLILLDDLGVCQRLSSSRRRWVVCRYFLFRTDQTEGQPSDPRRDYIGPAWFPIDQLPDMLWPEQRQLIERNRDHIHLLLRESQGL